MPHYIIRYNHHHKTNTSQPIWRVFEDGREILVNDLEILCKRVYTESSISPDDGLVKWNLACDGTARIEGDKLIIQEMLKNPLAFEN